VTVCRVKSQQSTLTTQIQHPLSPIGALEDAARTSTNRKESKLIALRKSSVPTLHVFEQDGGWLWGITVARSAGYGEKVVAYSDTVFRTEMESRADGERALVIGEWELALS
jgi:hypothetical protein